MSRHQIPGRNPISHNPCRIAFYYEKSWAPLYINHRNQRSSVKKKWIETSFVALASHYSSTSKQKKRHADVLQENTNTNPYQFSYLCLYLRFERPKAEIYLTLKRAHRLHCIYIYNIYRSDGMKVNFDFAYYLSIYITLLAINTKIHLCSWCVD